MKGRKLTLQEVLNLEDGTKVWVEELAEDYRHCSRLYEKNGHFLYTIKKIRDYYDLRDDFVTHIEFYEWIEGESFSKLWDSIQKTVYEIEHDCYIPIPYDETIEYNMAQEICNLRGLDLTDDNIRLIVEEFS